VSKELWHLALSGKVEAFRDVSRSGSRARSVENERWEEQQKWPDVARGDLGRINWRCLLYSNVRGGPRPMDHVEKSQKDLFFVCAGSEIRVDKRERDSTVLGVRISVGLRGVPFNGSKGSYSSI
jgi:hypothetical protein